MKQQAAWKSSGRPDRPCLVPEGAGLLHLQTYVYCTVRLVHTCAAEGIHFTSSPKGLKNPQNIYLYGKVETGLGVNLRRKHPDQAPPGWQGVGRPSEGQILKDATFSLNRVTARGLFPSIQFLNLREDFSFVHSEIAYWTPTPYQKLCFYVYSLTPRQDGSSGTGWSRWFPNSLKGLECTW